MSEQIPDNGSYESWEIASQLFGEHIEPPQTNSDSYDERREIVEGDIGATVQDMRDTMREATQVTGMDVDEQDIAAWMPSTEAELAKLRVALAPQRKRLDMIQGLIALYAKKEREANEAGVPLRPHQLKLMKDITNFMLYAPRSERLGGAGLGKSGVIDVPTGVGKTAVFSKTAAALKYGENPADPVRVLVLVPTQKILEQTMGRRGERGFGKFAPHLDVGAYYQDEKNLSNDVTVMCNASFNALYKSGSMPDYDVVIVDEAHTVMGETTSENLEEYMADKVTIGLTATTADFDADKSVYRLFEHVISRMKLPEAVRTGLLAPVRGHLLKVKAHVDPRTLPDNPAERKRAIRQAQLEARMEEAEKIIKQAARDRRGVIVRCPPGDDINHAVNFAARVNDLGMGMEQGTLNARWLLAGYVGGSIKRQSKADRDVIFENYDVGNVDVLTYVKAIGMGYDSPYAKVFINLDPSTSATEMTQAIGRVMRLTFGKDGQPIEAEVYDFQDPELGDRQYTCLDVLQTKSGELLAHDPVETDPTERPGSHNIKHHAEITEITVKTLGTVTLAHGVDVQPPTPEEIKASIIAYGEGNEEVSTSEACRILGVNPPTLKTMLRDVGSHPDRPVKVEELGLLLDLYPDLKAPKLPQEGYMSAVEAARTIPGLVRTFSFLRHARSQGYHPQRFTSPSGQVGFYFDEETAERAANAYIHDFKVRLPKKS